MSRRLKLDMRNDCESVIAGVQHWYRPNNAATGQSVTLYERHPVSARFDFDPEMRESISAILRSVTMYLLSVHGGERR